jgi:hypothetical protein
MTPSDSPLDDQRITPRGSTQFARKPIPSPSNPVKSNTCETPKTPGNQGDSEFFTGDSSYGRGSH